MEPLLIYKNLKLLWWLRNIAISGQVTTIFLVTYFLEIPLPIKSLLLILSISLIINLLTWWRIKKVCVITDKEFFAQLLIDMLALFGLLYLTGGATNPFTSLFILQVVFAAITLPALFTWAIACIAITFYTILMFVNEEVPYLQHHHGGDFFSLHVQGMWVSFIMLAIIIAWFVVRMNGIIRRQDSLLAEAEKIAALGTLATSAAHELGTPLATMAVIAGDCEPELARGFLEQINRCKQILSSITAAGGLTRAESSSPIELDIFLHQIVEKWQEDHADVAFEVDIAEIGKQRILVEHSFGQAIVNLLNNAADASPEFVKIKAKSTAQLLIIQVQDRGYGISDAIKLSIGEAGVSDKEHGLGLGLFLAKSVVTRMGGTLKLENAPDKGTIALISLPIKRLLI